jgi:REP element-mobilizing transposase RayT
MLPTERQRPPRLEYPGCSYFITIKLLKSHIVTLTEPKVAPLVTSALKYFDGDRYLLFEYTVMPDHLHFIIKPLEVDGKTLTLAKILHGLKSFTAHEINKLLNRSGSLWEDGGYDHIIRNRLDYEEKARYIFMNAKNAGLVDDPVDWPWWGRGLGEP